MVALKTIATGTNALEHIVDVVYLEMTWQCYHWHVDAAKAEGAMATLTIEVGVQVVEMLTLFAAVAIVVAHGILERAATIVNGMDEVMREKQSDAAVNCRLVDSVEAVLQTLQGERLLTLHHLSQHQNANCRWFYSTMLK